MNKEEIKIDEKIEKDVKFLFEKTLKKFVDNPNEMFDNYDLTIKYNKLLKEKMKLQQENKQLKENWNKLKEKIKEIDNFQRELNGIPNTRMTPYYAILEIMQELEKGEDE